MHFLKKLLATAAVLGVFMTPSAALFIKEPVQTANASAMVKVTVEAGEGSGFYVGNGLVVTAAHVIDGAQTIRIKSQDGTVCEAAAVNVDKEHDVGVARITGDCKLPSTATISCRIPTIGEALEAVGNPLEMEGVRVWGRVAATPRAIGPWGVGVLVDMTSAPGLSGAPVYDRNGEVVGIVVGAKNSAYGIIALTVMVPGSVLCGAVATA